MPNTNIKNIGDGYEQEIPHSDIYDARNWENLITHQRIFLMTNILGIFLMRIIQEN